MKLLALALLVTLPAFAADKEETIHTKATVRIYGITCQVRAGGEGRLEDRLLTVLGEGDSKRAVITAGELELTHNLASAQGCELAKLDRIVDASNMSFGFLRDVPAELKKVKTDPYKTQDGQCLMQVNESITVDIGEGITLRSDEGIIRKATGCR